MFRRALLLVTLPLLLAGCTTAKKAYHRATEDLTEAVTRYHDGLRTGDVDRAAAFIPAADRPAFYEAVTRLSKERRFTDHRIGPTEFPQGASEATVTVTRSYYLLNELTEKQETVNQTWLWKAKELRWQLQWTGKP